mmetsp:Transcript_7843/g.28672  ORF Transcript_7843/g.28672 Transcript_7843/m.28672 type:complete len:177 (-) Transcript_7843:188-718(-)|eukprot:CAMPEP_0203935204 /NCGR_PEP_ID=MMETSP0359-20131031/73012_1 /ASSEMBLY_ACC=CAM_ASM_000338 /TAXON_ID=268821 /ORGANISM="Scrippsiella Hangoei, Strain SHTV-5" /LENGTH=176 /DNA_ID=CAMNT_0050865027 /DNA_START=100 /DNA_END=630 /DNA_ORIENTATION=-
MALPQRCVAVLLIAGLSVALASQASDCSVQDGSRLSSSYHCTCGPVECKHDETCDAAAGACIKDVEEKSRPDSGHSAEAFAMQSATVFSMSGLWQRLPPRWQALDYHPAASAAAVGLGAVASAVTFLIAVRKVSVATRSLRPADGHVGGVRDDVDDSAETRLLVVNTRHASADSCV